MAGHGRASSLELNLTQRPVSVDDSGEVMWRQFSTPLNVPNSSGGSVVIGAGGWSSGDSSGALANDSTGRLVSRRLAALYHNDAGAIITRGTGLNESGFSLSSGSTLDIGGNLNLTGGGSLIFQHPLGLGSGDSVSLGNGTININTGVIDLSGGISTNWRYQFELSGSDVSISGFGSMVMDAASSDFVLTGFTHGDQVTGTIGEAVLLKFADGDFYYNGTLQGDDFALRLQGNGNGINTVVFGSFGSAAVPEPASLASLFAGAFALGVRRRRK